MPPKAAGRSDIFQTPPSSITPLLQFIPQHWKIWESAAGGGNIVETLKTSGYDVFGTDILNGFDFLSTLSPAPDFDCIITNPPYSIKDKWLQRCYDLGKPFALLMPITALGEQGRVGMYKKHGIQLVMLPERTDFETPSGEGSGAWFYCAWFCHGLDLPSQITFV